MRKNEGNYNHFKKPVENSPSTNVSSNDADEAYLFSDLTTDKPDRIEMCRLLPFINERIAFRMPSEIKYLDGVLDYLNERLIDLGIVQAGDSEVLIALDEAIVNAIKHGNKCDPRKAVHIIAELSADGARFVVSDEGPGFQREKVPDPRDPCRLLEPSGRGLLLINHIMDEVCYNQAGNRLEMFKRARQARESQTPPSNESWEQ